MELEEVNNTTVRLTYTPDMKLATLVMEFDQEFTGEDIVSILRQYADKVEEHLNESEKSGH